MLTMRQQKLWLKSVRVKITTETTEIKRSLLDHHESHAENTGQLEEKGSILESF